MDFEQRKKKIENDFANHINMDMADLKEKRTIICNALDLMYSTLVMCGESCFPRIFDESGNKEEKECFGLTEKCLSRSRKIYDLQLYFDEKDSFREEINDAKMLWSIFQHELVPLEIFWCMEHADEKEMFLWEKYLFLHLKKVAEHFLSMTDKFECVHQQIKKENNKQLVKGK